MSHKAGVWIDQNQAIVILITDAGHEIKKLKSGNKQPSLGSKRPKNEYTPNDFVPEDRRERKLVDELKKMFDEVLACISGVDTLLIIGPGEVKGDFSKHITRKKVRGLSTVLETADKMTERQLVAKVSEYYRTKPARKSATPKKMAKKKAVKVVVGKRTKKS